MFSQHRFVCALLLAASAALAPASCRWEGDREAVLLCERLFISLAASSAAQYSDPNATQAQRDFAATAALSATAALAECEELRYGDDDW